MSARRVLVSTDAVGGVWVYTLGLVAALRPEFECEVAVVGPTPAAALAEARAAGVAVHVTGLALDWTAAAPEELAAASARLAALAGALGVDLVQLHTPALVGAARWPAPVVAVLHSCVGTWWRAMRGDQVLPADFAWRMAAVRAGLAAADVVISPSGALRQAVREAYRTSREIEVVHNASFAPVAVGAGRREGVLAAGRLWDEAKNIALLDRAAALMDGVMVSAAGATAGPNGATVSLSAMRHLGEVTRGELGAAMGAARIFASPARYEPFGLAVLEAARAGLALVLADTPGFRELWEGAAVFLPVEDAAVWARGLTALHGRPDEAARWGALAQARAADFDGAVFARRMRAIYERLAPDAGRVAA